MRLDLSACRPDGLKHKNQNPCSNSNHCYGSKWLKMGTGISGISSCASKPACSTWHVNRFAHVVTFIPIPHTIPSFAATLCQRPSHSPIMENSLVAQLADWLESEFASVKARSNTCICRGRSTERCKDWTFCFAIFLPLHISKYYNVPYTNIQFLRTVTLYMDIICIICT